MTKFNFLLLALVFGLSACGPEARFSKAKKYEEKGRYYQAWEAYQEFAARNPDHPRAPEALFRAGWVAQRGLTGCHAALLFYDRVTAEYPQSQPWASAAALQKMNCPDYFPLIPGSEWEEVDSETRGRIAKIKIEALPLTFNKTFLPSEAARLKRTFYSGDKKFRSGETVYKKVNQELLEFASEKDPVSKTILKWPVDQGKKWEVRASGRLIHFEVVSISEIVKVAAGEFKDCVKIRSTISGQVGATYEYYAPGVGRVLTTLSTGKGEKRNTELISYRIPPHPGFEASGGKKSEEKNSDEE